MANIITNKSGKWQVYLLFNSRGRTYIGATTDVNRRVRQHRGEIRGGARSTRGDKTWNIYCYLHGFQNRSEAYRWEKLLKLRCRGKQGRIEGFLDVFLGICPVRSKHTRTRSVAKKQKLYEVPLNLVLNFNSK